MADDVKQERTYSVTITIFVGSMSQSQAQALEDDIRDVAEPYGVNVNASRGQPIATPGA